MYRGQLDDLIALSFKERNGRNDERVRTLSDKAGKACVNSFSVLAWRT
jgi:hypothetical protein